MPTRSSGGTPATVALRRSGVPFTLHAYDHDPRAASYGLEAAAALGLDPARVFKTLLALVDPPPGSSPRGRLVVGIVPVSVQLDLKALARTLGGSRATMADAADAQRATGYVVGGISPIGQKRAHPTVVDTSALDHSMILVSAGRRGLDLEIAPADLVLVTSALLAPISRA